MNDVALALSRASFGCEILPDEPLSWHTTFRIGGPADALALPREEEELASLLRFSRAEGIPVFLLGGGANVLVGDRGFRGLVVATSRMDAVRVDRDSCVVTASCGARVDDVANAAAARSLSGLEFASRLPGSIGGAVFMNARCYDREFADVLDEVCCLDATTFGRATIRVARDEWAYKRTPFMPGGAREGCVVVEARFRLAPGDRDAIEARMGELALDREKKGHFDYPSAGSMFKNDRAFGRPTGAILDELGFRGRSIGDAMVSPKHANIFVNAGKASAADMRALVEEAKDAARRAFGFELEPEVRFLGEF